MDMKDFIKKHVDQGKFVEDAITAILTSALLCSKNHHEKCTTGNGTETSKIYYDLLRLMYNGEIKIVINAKK